MIQANSYAAQQSNAPLVPFNIKRRELRPDDVHIEVLYCGVCHSDLHTSRNEWQNTIYPVVPGHEVIGKVLKTGKDVSSFSIGDTVAVGCLVDSCGICNNCQENLEQFCNAGAIFTYNGKDKNDQSVTYGGYSTELVVNEGFVLKVPPQFNEQDYPGVAPLLCAGITTYSPFKHWEINHRSKVGIVGVGGIGHLAIKMARAMGAHVVVFTSSSAKMEDAMRLGAHEVIYTKNLESLKKYTKTLDFILDTVSAHHDLNLYLELLKRDGTLCLVGIPENPHPPLLVSHLIFARRQITGTLIGGLRETQEMLNFCGLHGIKAEIEMIRIQQINEAYDRLLKNDVKYRFVIDMSSLKSGRG